MDLIVIGGPPPRRYAGPVLRPLDVLAPWYGDLTPNQRMEFHEELTAFSSKWREAANANVEALIHSRDLAAV